MKSAADLVEQDAVQKIGLGASKVLTTMSDHCSTYFQGLWPDGRLILDVTLNEMVILQWFHQDFVLSSASREVTVTGNSYIFLKTKSRQFPSVPAWISKAQCSKHGQNPTRCVFDWSMRNAIRPWEYSNSFFWWNRFSQIWAPELQSIVQMWRLPCLISIEWINHEMTSSARRPIPVTMWKTFLCQVTTPMTRPSREFTRSRTIWDQPPAWQPKSRTTAFLVGFGSLHSAICWGWFYFWKLNGFCEFATKKTRKSSQVLLSYEILSFFFDIFSLLGFPPFTAARWALWEWRIARRVVSAWTRPATCGIAVALFVRKNILFNTKNHRSSNIMIDPQVLSIGTFDQKADLPLPRSSSPKKMEERSKSLNALSRIHLYRRSWARCTQRSFACRWIHCRLWPLPTWHSNTEETLEGINQSTNQPSLNLWGSEVNTKFPAFAPFADVRYLHHIISSKMPVLSLMLVLSIKPAAGRQSGPSSFVGNFLTFFWHQQVP